MTPFGQHYSFLATQQEKLNRFTNVKDRVSLIKQSSVFEMLPFQKMFGLRPDIQA
jgi:hypothetical protein